MQSLEQALAAVQMAKKLNDAGKLGDGQGASSLEDYKRMYEEMLARNGQGDGQGQGDGKEDGKGGRGEGGSGGKVEENDAAKSDFVTEHEHGQLTAGKMLMQWKTHGPSEKGQAQEEYQRSVREVRQGVSEALTREQVPPGYHEAVQRYFDDVGAEASGTASPARDAPANADGR
jgi:hypothetical protein